MICLPLDEIRAGMVLGKSIVGEQGDLLLAAGFVINERILAKMQSMEMTGCWIYEAGTELVAPEEAINDQLAMQAQSTLRNNADLLRKALQIRDVTVDAVKKAMSEPSRFRNIIAADAIKSVAQEILDALIYQAPVAVNLNSLRTKSGYHYQHALDVAITSILLAQKLRLTHKEIEELAMGCLLMDMGMVILSDSMVRRSGPPTEEEEALMREHPSFGYAILRENDRIPLNVSHVAYQHHERQDGNGYPRQLRGENTLTQKALNGERGKIHRYAEIAAAADYYVTMVAPLPGTALPRSPEEAVKGLILAAGGHLNRAVVDTLITLIPFFPVGARVGVVHDLDGRYVGFSGVVAKAHREEPEKPLILLIHDRDRRKIQPIPLDLTEFPGIKIQFSRI